MKKNEDLTKKPDRKRIEKTESLEISRTKVVVWMGTSCELLEEMSREWGLEDGGRKHDGRFNERCWGDKASGRESWTIQT